MLVFVNCLLIGDLINYKGFIYDFCVRLVGNKLGGVGVCY